MSVQYSWTENSMCDIVDEGHLNSDIVDEGHLYSDIVDEGHLNSEKS
jgi:hypothetical protein